MSSVSKEMRDFYTNLPSGLEDTQAQSLPFTSQWFEETREYRYKVQPFHFEICEFWRWRERYVLEIGVGMGVDHCEFAKNGAKMTGIDITPRHIEITKKRLEFYNLKSNLIVADAVKLPFDDESFDLVYSFGVLFLTSDICQAISEIYRVLKPGGEVIVMLYHKNSAKYYLKTVLYDGMVWGDLWNRSLRTLLNWSTDGYAYPQNGFFTQKEAKRLFHGFTDVNTSIYHLKREHIPLVGAHLPQEIIDFYAKYFGLFLVIRGKKQ
jgi:ubiquinone/menaquinone biosynthesis C-methylase UbiE